MADCQAAMQALDMDRMKLSQATGLAEKAISLIETSTDALTAISKRYKLMREANYSKWRMKWIWAIRRVIIQMAVAKNTVIWEAYEEKLSAAKVYII